MLASLEDLLNFYDDEDEAHPTRLSEKLEAIKSVMEDLINLTHREMRKSRDEIPTTLLRSEHYWIPRIRNSLESGNRLEFTMQDTIDELLEEGL